MTSTLLVPEAIIPRSFDKEAVQQDVIDPYSILTKEAKLNFGNIWPLVFYNVRRRICSIPRVMASGCLKGVFPGFRPI